MSGTYADILKKKSKDWGCPELMDSVDKCTGDKIPFSSPMMNYATYGGIPRNKITEFFGDPGGGKTSTAVDICKQAIEMFRAEHEQLITDLSEAISKGDKSAVSRLEDVKETGPKRVLYIDIEHAFDSKWSKTLGLDRVDIDIMQPPDIPAEELLQSVEDIISTNEVGLVVLDSIPSLVPKAELEKKLGERTVASLAGLLTVFTRKIVPLLTRYETTMLVINQIRDNMDNPYVVKTPGGQALKFYSSLRIYFRLGTPVDFLGNELPQRVEDPAGYIVNAKLVKQKTAPHDRKIGTYYLMTKSGIRPDFDYANLAIKKYGIIRKGGAWFTVCNPETGEILEVDGKQVKLNGLAKVYEFLQNNPDYYEILKNYILNDINGSEESEEVSHTGDLV